MLISQNISIFLFFTHELEWRRFGETLPGNILTPPFIPYLHVLVLSSRQCLSEYIPIPSLLLPFTCVGLCWLHLTDLPIGGELYESVGVEAPILLSNTHKNEWNTHVGLPTRCQRSAMGVSLIFVGVRQQNGCFDTHTFIQFSTYGSAWSEDPERRRGSVSSGRQDRWPLCVVCCFQLHVPVYGDLGWSGAGTGSDVDLCSALRSIAVPCGSLRSTDSSLSTVHRLLVPPTEAATGNWQALAIAVRSSVYLPVCRSGDLSQSATRAAVLAAVCQLPAAGTNSWPNTQLSEVANTNT